MRLTAAFLESGRVPVYRAKSRLLYQRHGNYENMRIKHELLTFKRTLTIPS